MFEVIKNILLTKFVKTIPHDFEAEVWSTISEIQPDVTILECYFHCVQSVRRHGQELHLQQAYNNNQL